MTSDEPIYTDSAAHRLAIELQLYCWFTRYIVLFLADSTTPNEW